MSGFQGVEDGDGLFELPSGNVAEREIEIGGVFVSDMAARIQEMRNGVREMAALGERNAGSEISFSAG